MANHTSSQIAPWLSQHTALLVTSALVAVCLFIFGLEINNLPLRLVSKGVPVVVLMIMVLGLNRQRYGKIIATGLGFCVVGDILLELKGLFVPGMIAFLLGHLCYIGAFFGKQTRLNLLNAIPFALWVGWAIALMWPGLGVLQIPVTLYTLTIFVMMWRASALVARWPKDRWMWCAAIGAISFGLSDTLIAINKFHTSLGEVRIPIILTYWAGQCLIAISVLSQTPSGDIKTDVNRST